MAGSGAGCVTDTLDVPVGTSQDGKPPGIRSATVFELSNGASATVALVVSLVSMKKSSGASPLFVIVTGTVTGVPAASVVETLSGSPTAEARVWLNTMSPLYGSDTSSPSTGSANSTASVQVPGAGCSVYAVSESPLVPSRLFWP